MADKAAQAERGERAWADISALFSELGTSDYVGEPVSQSEHLLQAAKCAADATKSRVGEPARDEVVLAALLHDVGHMLGLRHRDSTQWMGDCGAMHHERTGADWLRSLGVTERVAALVQQHVSAKRFLTATNPRYYEKLSPASRTTLGYQGGPMTPAECAAFESNPDKDVILLMRTWDEAAKVAGKAVPPLSQYRAMLVANVQGNAVGGTA